ncbi:MAG TPA: hypothetical protein PLQ35_09780 [bacterium]|nr:hypothetical protein [bacterium]HQL62572.1 hypothetical protein [bacterium]
MNRGISRDLIAALVRMMCITAVLGGHSVCQDIAEPKDNHSAQKYESFQLIISRNIFNPNRKHVSAESLPSPVARTPTVEEIIYVGMIDTGAGTYAFFEGSDADYQGVLSVGDTIAGCTVTVIDPGHVSLQSSGTSLDLPVGSRIVRQDGGRWEVAAVPARKTLPGHEPGNRRDSAEPAVTKSEPAAQGAGSDLLQRMMERRKQERKEL